MKRYTIMLGDKHVERLKRMAEYELKTEDQLIADLNKRYAVESGHEHVFAMDGIVRGPGGPIADIPDEELMKGFGE